MTEAFGLDSRGSVLFVRRGLLALTTMTILAAAFELATVQHWHDFEQRIPWAALLVLAMAMGLLLCTARWARIASRALAILVLGAATFGVVDHTMANYDAGPLDQRFAQSWDSIPSAEQWWYAVTKNVGPAPTLAPGVLGLAAMLLLLASVINTHPSRTG